jgi:hypothetical protein
MREFVKEFYLGHILDEVKTRSKFEKVICINRNKVEIPEPRKKQIRIRQPKGTVKVFVLLASEELVDLTFKKSEANDWMKQDDDNEVKIFYVKEKKDELGIGKDRRKAISIKRKSN